MFASLGDPQAALRSTVFDGPLPADPPRADFQCQAFEPAPVNPLAYLTRNFPKGASCVRNRGWDSARGRRGHTGSAEDNGGETVGSRLHLEEGRRQVPMVGSCWESRYSEMKATLVPRELVVS